MEEPSEQKAVSEELKKFENALKVEQAKSKDYLERLKYLQADFENYRRRMEKEFAEVTQRSKENLVVNLLSVLDDLERAIETGKTTENTKALLEGVEMVHKRLSAVLEKEGLEEIDAVGRPFDPHMHEILVKIPSEKCDEGTVIEESRKGFTLKGRVIRPSVVKIACKEEDEVE